MKESSKNLIKVALALVTVLVVYLILHQPQPSDRDQIRSQIAAAQQAAEQRRVSRLMSVISAQYHDSHALNVDSLHFYLSRNLSQAEGFSVSVVPRSIMVQGDQADSVCHVIVRTDQEKQAAWEQDVTLHWKREDGYRLLVVPTKVWRVVSADYPGGPD